MGSNSSTTDSTTTKLHAYYVEVAHQSFLTVLAGKRNEAIAISPYAGVTAGLIEDDFFSVGYTLSSFPSLYDMFGKFMAGLDIEDVWKRSFDDVLLSAEISAAIRGYASMLNDKVAIVDIPAYQIEARDNNAAGSSTFIIGQSLIEAKKIKDTGKFSIKVVTDLIATTEDKFIKSLNDNIDVIRTYARILKMYYEERITTDEVNGKFLSEDKLWPFTILEYERKGLGAFSPATRQALQAETIPFMKTTAGKIVSVVSWTAQGAYIGSYFGPYGTVIGGIVGFIIGLADIFILNG